MSAVRPLALRLSWLAVGVLMLAPPIRKRGKPGSPAARFEAEQTVYRKQLGSTPYVPIATQILNAVSALLAYAAGLTPTWVVAIRRDTEENPIWNPGESLPRFVLSMNDSKPVQEGTAIKVFMDYPVQTSILHSEKPGDKGDSEKLRLIREQVRQLLHVIVGEGTIQDVAGNYCMNDVHVFEQKPYSKTLDSQTVNVSPLTFVYQTFEVRT